jgi:hypothetical protein
MKKTGLHRKKALFDNSCCYGKHDTTIRRTHYYCINTTTTPQKLLSDVLLICL